jgi:hypothetical protein
MYPIITSYEELLYYLGRYDYLNPSLDEAAEESTSHFGDKAGDPRLSAEPLTGNPDA